jgi:hypothetical protein
VPKPEKGKGKLADQLEEEPVSRLEQLRLDGMEPEMPPNPAPHLVGHLMELGPTEVAGMDRVPISWLTIDAWQRCSGITLHPWEARLIRHLSSAFLAESHKAEKVDCPEPWSERPTQERRDAIEQKIRGVLSGRRRG